jgi:hypothetical protein
LFLFSDEGRETITPMGPLEKLTKSRDLAILDLIPFSLSRSSDLY